MWNWSAIQALSNKVILINLCQRPLFFFFFFTGMLCHASDPTHNRYWTWHDEWTGRTPALRFLGSYSWPGEGLLEFPSPSSQSNTHLKCTDHITLGIHLLWLYISRKTKLTKMRHFRVNSPKLLSTQVYDYYWWCAHYSMCGTALQPSKPFKIN